MPNSSKIVTLDQSDRLVNAVVEILTENPNIVLFSEQDRFDLLECIQARENEFAVNDRTFWDYTSDDRTNFHAKMDRLRQLMGDPRS